MIAPYLTFHGNCEEAFTFYKEAFGGGKTEFTRLHNDLQNPIMHASVSFNNIEGCIMGADVEETVAVSGMAICVVLPTRQVIEEVAEKLAVGGTLLQRFIPHPPPHEMDGGSTVLDKYGYTWHLST